MDARRRETVTRLRTGRLSRRKALQMGGAGLAATLAAAFARSASAQDTTDDPPAAGVTPASVAAALAGLDGLAEELLTRSGVPGMAISVVYQDEVVYLKGFGVREAGKPEAIDPDTVFQLASVSKPISSTIVAGVMGDGAITWDSRITDLDPDFQLFDPVATREVTLRDMFAHRSGLPGHAGDDLEDIGYDRAEVLHRLRYLPPGSSFRAAHVYTNFGLTEAAVAAAKTAGITWEDLAAEKLYQPLGMTSTSSRYSDFLAAENRALGHVLVDGQYVAKYQRDPDPQSPAGGVSSTVRDMATWVRLQLGNGAVDGRQIIGADALAETHRPQIVSNPPVDPSVDRAGFHGLGWNVGYTEQGRVRLNHSGGFLLGAATVVMMQPADELGVVVLTNALPIGLPEAVANSFFDLAQTGSVQRDYLALIGPYVVASTAPSYGTPDEYANPPAQPSPALTPDAYVGTFDNDYFGALEAVTRDDGLALRLGPQQTAFAMRHYDRDLFLYQPVGENAGGPSGMTFEIGADGHATSVTVQNLDVHGQGTFTRAVPTP